MPSARICSVDGCGNPYRCKGFCELHYKRFLANGTPEFKGNASPALDYFNTVVLTWGQDECLIWPFFRSAKGYGRMRWKGKLHYVHRLADQILNGEPLDQNYDAAHTCGNGHLGCCNPKHIIRCTRKQNRSHMIKHGTLQVGEAVPSSRLTNGQVLQIKAMIGKVPQNEIANYFSVGESTIWSIRAGLSWGWLTGINPRPSGQPTRKLYVK